jgi:hypothetical protein
MVNETSKPMILVFMLSVYLFLTGCTSTINGVREDVSKPFIWVGKVGDKIAPCKETKDQQCND